MTVHLVKEGEAALAAASPGQRVSYNRLRRRCSIRGVILLSDDTLQVGFESRSGRDREAVIAPDGSRISTFNTYGR